MFIFHGMSLFFSAICTGAGKCDMLSEREASVMKLLMHICCAPCANMPIDALRAEGVELTGYWYNPNIHPFTEYRARRN